jgi:hypothetical protein
MSVAEFIAAIAWPVVVLIIALLFRKSLKDALASATGRLAAGPFSLEWKRRVTDVEDDLGLPPSISEGEIGGAAGKLDEISEHSPPAAIVEAFARVEVSLRSVLEENSVAIDGASWSVRHLADIARDEGLITAETHDAIEGLSVLRNLAVHGGEKDISPQRAHEFVALAQGVVYAITSNAKRRSF